MVFGKGCQDRPAQRLKSALGNSILRNVFHLSKNLLVFFVLSNSDTANTLYQDFQSTVRQLQRLDDTRNRTDIKQIIGRWIFDACIALCDEQKLFVRLLRRRDIAKSTKRLLASDEERHNHLREDNNVSQRQHRHHRI